MSLRDGDAFRVVAAHGAPPAFVEQRQREPLDPPDRGTIWIVPLRTEERSFTLQTSLADPESRARTIAQVRRRANALVRSAAARTAS